MSQENVEAVRAVYEEWAKGNFRAGTDLYDPLVLFIPIPEFPAAEHYLGKDGVRDFMLTSWVLGRASPSRQRNSPRWETAWS